MQPAKDGNVKGIVVRGETFKIVAVGDRAQGIEARVKQEDAVERDEFGLPIQKYQRERSRTRSRHRSPAEPAVANSEVRAGSDGKLTVPGTDGVDDDDRGRSREGVREPEVKFESSGTAPEKVPVTKDEPNPTSTPKDRSQPADTPPSSAMTIANPSGVKEESKVDATDKTIAPAPENQFDDKHAETNNVDAKHVEKKTVEEKDAEKEKRKSRADASGLESTMFPEYREQEHVAAVPTVVSEWSHQAATIHKEEEIKEDTKEAVEGDDDEGWQEMPVLTKEDIYDDFGRLVVKAREEEVDETDRTEAKKGYTRVCVDEDAKSTTSMEEHTQYLFPDQEVDDDASRNPLSQMEATKELLTEGQKIAYVGLCRLVMADMVKDIERLSSTTSRVKKELAGAADSTKMWGQKIMIRLYSHMDVNSAEQIMIEQLADHGVVPADLTPTLMKNARVKNPMADENAKTPSSPEATFDEKDEKRTDSFELKASSESDRSSLTKFDPPPIYQEEDPRIKDPSEMTGTKTLDIDIRWTVLCDLFLVLIADSSYDARSRRLLEQVAEYLSISWLDICSFEKRVTDALEMQENAQQNWSEEEHMENRRKQARNRRYMMVGLATIGGSLVIGLSGGLLAPVIGAGLAAGLGGLGVAGASSFLVAGAGPALIASGAVVSGGSIAAKASMNRTKSVSTFEFRPLHNSKRVNLIITISGWMNGTEDDVRLPYSTVDPIMGDIFSVLWEPEILRSTGKTMNILATEVLTQTLQQAIGATVLAGALMASLQVPMILSKLAYLLDNPWNVSLDRAVSAGLVLADCIMSKNLGSRPITLVGFSLGARVIWSCLKELSKHKAYGYVQNVYMFGTPVVAKKNDYMRMRAVVPGRFVNGYARNDWILGYLFRATGGGLGRVAGLAPVEEIPGLENVDVTDIVEGHMAYRASIPKLLQKVGWEVVDDEFTEIEEPDPDQHRERQRELIDEIEEARKAAEKQPPKKKFFGLFSRGNTKKQAWETYDEGKEGDEKDEEAKKAEAHKDDVLFDVEAIRKELAVQVVEAKYNKEQEIPQRSSSVGPADLNLKHAHSYSGPMLDGEASNPFKDRYAYDSDSEDEFGNKINKTGDNIQLTFDSEPTVKSTPSPWATRPEISKSATLPDLHNTWEDSNSSKGWGDERSATQQQYSAPIPTVTTTTTDDKGKKPAEPSINGAHSSTPAAAWSQYHYDEFEDDGWGEEKDISMSFA